MSTVIVQGLGSLGLSPKAKAFVSRKIKHLITKEGKKPAQAVAIALNMARARGFKVPRSR